MKLISWNIARRKDAWQALLKSDADIGIIQEANTPPIDLIENGQVDNVPNNPLNFSILTNFGNTDQLKFTRDEYQIYLQSACR